MNIRAEYRVTVDIPEKVWAAFAGDPQFERDRMDACSGHLESGSSYYAKPYEWAVFSTRKKAEECQRKLMDVVYKWAAKLPEELK
jgi:hypothetical protein